ncbi:YqiA/YcfP family alpha/beta fold hydrolase [Aquabacterium sp. J223]|uniref:YqiA/YcfP family alpha/beta fold hydrolase n=1 Tax=Aquabacterium sp. J223 TaxID=2898431 RepID=UPI0028A0AEE1|nr:YqiA/YcfP family alpha/beta fold hydrolase [Aquabacterium sp. J223]
MRHLLYLHGFRSSPSSAKARGMSAWMAEHRPDIDWACPQLPPSPDESMALVERLTAHWPADEMAVIGSSLGGFYASVLAHRRGCRAVLLNPAVHPDRDLAHQIGELTAWHDPQLRFRFGPEHVDQLRAMTPPADLDTSRWLAIVAKGDEVLDWREMLARCQGGQVVLLDGGDHALSDFETAHRPTVLRFLGLA